MGILPLQFRPARASSSLGLTGEEVFDFAGLPSCSDRGLPRGREITVAATAADGSRSRSSRAVVRIDTPQEVRYYQHGGILQYVLRQLLGGRDRPEALTPAPVSAAHPPPAPAPDDREVDTGSEQSFPASDPPAY